MSNLNPDQFPEEIRVSPYSIGAIHGVQAYQGSDPVKGTYLGGAMYRDEQEHAVVHSVTVEPEHRRKGVGRTLLSAIEETTGKPVRIGPGKNTAAGKALFRNYEGYHPEK